MDPFRMPPPCPDVSGCSSPLLVHNSFPGIVAGSASGDKPQDTIDNPVLLFFLQARVEWNGQYALSFGLCHRQSGSIRSVNWQQMVGIVMHIGVDSLAVQVLVEFVACIQLDDRIVTGTPGVFSARQDLDIFYCGKKTRTCYYSLLNF